MLLQSPASAVDEGTFVRVWGPHCAGFFFGVRRAIQQWAYDEDNLFDPSNRLFRQEQVGTDSIV